MKLFSSRRKILATVAILLVLLFLLRPGASRLKARIANSISLAVARPVEIGSVHLRLLPRPGFYLENLIVHEDPAFGAEPMLRAQEVTANLRLLSLVRGRLEIARLNLNEPSLNLVRRPDGHWNLEALLEHAERMPLAPTAKPKSEARPGFPYIEATAGRINFKQGQEKKPYALTNADFALWQESENSWGVRLKAEPLRTDMSVSDTGLLRLDGTWQRAGALRETPLHFTLEWDRAQLGQLTKLASGDDRGWRGSVRLEAAIDGSPANLRLQADARIQDFRRFDISSGDSLTLSAQCHATYRIAEGKLDEILCAAPVGSGSISLRGNAGLVGASSKALTLELEQVPATAVAQLALHVKKDLPVDLAAAGILDGKFTLRQEESGQPRFQGEGEFENLRLASATNKAEIAPGNVPLVLASGANRSRTARKTLASGAKSAVVAGEAPNEPHLEFGPFPIVTGRPGQVKARGWAARSGYDVALAGEGEVAHLLRVARLFGLPALKASVEGNAQLNLHIAGSCLGWRPGFPLGFSSPRAIGTASLRNVRAEIRGVNGPVQIASAELQLLPEEVRVDRLVAHAFDAQWMGSLRLPRGCGTPSACEVHFTLNGDDVALSSVHEWLSPRPNPRHWYEFFASETPAGTLFSQNLRASGEVSVNRLRVHDVAAAHVSATLDLNQGKLRISDLEADLLGGKHTGTWQADFSAIPAVWSGGGDVTAISLDQLAAAMHDNWISGTMNGSYQLSGAGTDASKVWQTAQGALLFDIHDAALRRVALENDAEPLRGFRSRGSIRLLNGAFELNQARLNCSAGAYEVTGTASLARVLALKLTPIRASAQVHAGNKAYTITGTLADPRVTPVVAPETQARLKP